MALLRKVWMGEYGEPSRTPSLLPDKLYKGSRSGSDIFVHEELKGNTFVLSQLEIQMPLLFLRNLLYKRQVTAMVVDVKLECSAT